MEFIYCGDMAPVPIRTGSRAGDSLPLPAGALLCPLQCGVFCVCFQVLVACPECSWGSCCAGRQRVALQPEPGAALRCACLPSKGVSEPRYCKDGPQGHIRAATGSWWRVLWSRTLSVAMCSYQEDPLQGAENRSLPALPEGCPQQLCTGKATKSKRLWLLPLHTL